MLQGKQILVIEDDLASAYYLQEVITDLGGEVVLATSANEAKLTMEKNTVNLILMDVRLPDTDGYELTKYFREKGVTIPIIAQTAFAMISDRQKALEAGCNDYISKPIRKEIICDLLFKYLNGKA